MGLGKDFSVLVRLDGNKVKSDQPAVLQIKYVSTKKKPKFLNESSVKIHNNSKAPYTVEELNNNWVEDSDVVYIGCCKELGRRLQGLTGASRPNGARSLWQIKNNQTSLYVQWIVCETIEEAESLKEELLKEFENQYGKFPFANMKGKPSNSFGTNEEDWDDF